MKYNEKTYGLPAAARGEILAAVCRSHGVNVTEARVRADRDRGFADRLAKEVNAVLGILDRAYAQATGKASCLRETVSRRTTAAHNGNSLRRELAAALKQTGAKMTPLESLRMDAKSEFAFSQARAVIKPGKKMTDPESLVVYSCTRKSCMESIGLFDVERQFLTQDRHLVNAARKYCRAIGLNA